MKSKSSPKIILTGIALSLIILTGFSTKPALAFDLPDFYSLLPTSDNMFKWSNSFMTGLVSDSAMGAIAGCTLGDVTGPGVEAKVQQKCTSKAGFSIIGQPPQPAAAVPGSLLGMVSTALVELPRRSDAYPVNLAVYFNELKRDSLIFPNSAYAAAPTTFNDALFNTTVVGLWKVMRNLAYVFFVVMLVVFGFMVMFRYKINPQTVITVQEALPRVVINLLLITFSFPIAAFALKLIPFLDIFAITGSGIFNMSGSDILGAILINVLTFAATSNVVPGVGALFMSILVVGMLLAFLLTVIAVFISALTRFARIMMMTIFAPLQFAFATLPGKENLVTDWFKSLIGNVLAIPAIFLMFSIGFQIALSTGLSSAQAASDPVTKVIMGFMGQIIGWVIGFWFMWNAKNAPKWIEGAMGIGGGWSPGQAPRTAGRK